jgi:O-antigen ligase
MFLIGFAIQVIAVFLTFSRGGYLVLALVSLLVLFRERHRIYRGALLKIALVGISVLIILAIITGGVIDLMLTRAGTVIEFTQLLRMDPEQARQVDLSLWIRFQLVQAGIKMAVDKFPLGIGWENFRYYVDQ